jgi:hypothetical protein
VCFVPGAEQLEPRDVKVGRTTPELIEIIEGLTEGEEVALDPPGRTTSRPQTLAGFDSRPWPKDALTKVDDLPQLGPRNRRGTGGGEPRQGNRVPGDPSRKSRKRASDEG